MEKNSNRMEVKVGIFITVGLVVAMTSILLLGADKSIFTRYARIRTQLTEVQGLFPGSIVSLAGVPVGNIEKIDFVESANKLELTMRIDRKFADRLVEGMIAEERTQGALGDKFIYLTPGPPGSKPLANNSLVPATETDFMKLLTSREDGVARVIDLIKQVQELVANINQNGQSGVMMHNLTEASAKLNSTLGKIDALLGDSRPADGKLKTALVSLASILEKIDQGKGTLGQLINDPSVHQSLKAYLGASPRNKYMKDMIGETLKQSDKQ